MDDNSDMEGVGCSAALVGVVAVLVCCIPVALAVAVIVKVIL